MSLIHHQVLPSPDPAHVEARHETKTKSSPSHQSPRKPRHSQGRKDPTDSPSSSPEKSSRGGKNQRRQRSRRQRKRSKPSSSNSTVELPDESLFAALDCEMVGVGPNGHASSVARVTVIDWDGETIFDEYIQQTETVTDYRTFVSGITEEHLESAELSLEECREQVMQLLQNRILVGHALKNDLRALNIRHPWWLTRDTAKYEPFMQVRFDDGILWPRKLKDLVHEKLHQDIQVVGKPHCPYEDAKAALDLYRSVQTKWEKVIQYKVEKTNQIQREQKQHDVLETPVPAAQ